MPGRDRKRKKDNKPQSDRAKRPSSPKEGREPGASSPATSLHKDDVSRVLSLSQEERTAAIMELQRRYGNQRVQRMLARLVQPDPAESEDPNQVSPDIVERIDAQHGSGQPLDAGTRSDMEGSFGEDFSDVRVHTGSEADSLNQDVQARAFTTGNDIFFRGGNYAPGSSEGKELLAHELTHVVQQQGAGPSSGGPTRVTSPDDASEVEAAQVAEAVTGQEGVSRQAAGEEEEEVQMARQAEGEEEEELQMARQAEGEEEEEVQMAPQAEGEEEEVQMARQAEGMIARQPTEDDVKADEDQWVAVMEQLAGEAEGKEPKDSAEYAEALKTTGQALLETGMGKQLKEKAKGFLLSKEGSPFTITLGAGTLAALMATRAEVPSIPIELSDDMELDLDVKGPLDKPEGVMATFKMRF